MNDHNQQQLDEARQQYDLMADIATQVRAKLEAERDNPPEPDQIQAAISHCAEQVSSLKSKLKRHKESSKQRQEEIQSWQSWFEGVEAGDMSSAIDQLETEVSWRREDISRLEKLIGELYHQIHIIEADQMEKESQLTALSSGVLNAAVDEDPRLTGLLQEQAELKEKIKRLENAR